MSLFYEGFDDCEIKCPESDDGQHCVHWGDGDACCYCDSPAEAG